MKAPTQAKSQVRITVWETAKKEAGRPQSIGLEVGQSLRDGLKKAGLPLEGTCDGAMICSTCRVFLLGKEWGESRLFEREEEGDLLETLADFQTTDQHLAMEKTPVYPRLACQVLVKRAHQGLHLLLAETS